MLISHECINVTAILSWITRWDSTAQRHCRRFSPIGALMFAVTGITGKVGAAVARSLLAADQPVRAVIRDRSKSAPWARLGCDIAIADLEDTGALTTAFDGTAGVFAMLPPVFDPSPGFPESTPLINSLRDALARAKPPKAVVLSTIGADSPRPNLLNVLGRLEEV